MAACQIAVRARLITIKRTTTAAVLARRLARATAIAPAPLAQTRAALREDYEALAGAVASGQDAEPRE